MAHSNGEELHRIETNEAVESDLLRRRPGVLHSPDVFAGITGASHYLVKGANDADTDSASLIRWPCDGLCH
jgi:hypothetical protein